MLHTKFCGNRPAGFGEKDDEHVYTNLVKFCPSILKIFSKNQFRTFIKGCNSASLGRI